MALGRLLDLFAHRFLCFSSIFLCFSYSYVRHTKLASSVVNFWAHNKIVSDDDDDDDDVFFIVWMYIVGSALCILCCLLA